jgi:hypothetical protein
VEEHDLLGQRHGACGPGDDRLWQMRRDVEEVQHVKQHAHVATGQDEGRRAGQHLAHRGPVTGHDVALLGPPGRVELGVSGAHPLHVPFVDEPDDRLGVVERRRGRAAVPGPGDHRVDRAERRVELHEVELLELVDDRLVVQSRAGELAVTLVHVEPATVQPEVGAAATEQPVQLAVVGLAFLPAGGDRGDPGGGVHVGEDVVDRGPPLRPQHGHVHDVASPGVDVNGAPTSSSMPRRVS